MLDSPDRGGRWMTRRHLLRAGAGALSASLAGCIFSPGTGCGHGITFEMNGPLSAADIADAEAREPPELPPTARQLVETASQEGSATYTGATGPPIDEGTVVRLDDAYYRVSIQKGDDGTSVTGYEYTVVTNDSVRENATRGKTVEFDDLPEQDRRSFLAAFGRKAGGVQDRQVAKVRVEMLAAYESQAARRKSVFVPESEHRYVRYGPNVFRLDRDGPRTVTVFPFRIGLGTVATSVAAFAEHVRSTEGRTVEPSALSTDAREFVQQGISEEYGTQACYPLPDHVTAVLDAFGLEPERGQDARYVHYDGDWYRASVGDFYDD